MEKQKLDDNEIYEILASFESEFYERFPNGERDIQKVQFYTDFEIKGIRDFQISGVFVTQEVDEDGNVTHHLYYREPSNEILSIDADGNVQVSPEWREIIKDINFDKTMVRNNSEDGKLRGASERAKPEEMKKALKDDKQEQEDEQEQSEEEEIEQDLGEQGEDLGITNYKKIKDPHISEKMPEVFGGGEENGIAFSNKLNRFVIISKVNGQYRLNENIQPAQMTWKSIISIDPNGEKIERKVPYALMKMPNNQEKEIAVTIGQYGYVDIETVDVLPCQERVARAVRVEGEGRDNEQSREAIIDQQAGGKEYNHKTADAVNAIEEMQREQEGTADIDSGITEDDYIPETQMTWGELREGARGEPLETLITRYNEEMNKRGAKSSQEAVNTILADYGRLPGQRQKGTN